MTIFVNSASCVLATEKTLFEALELNRVSEQKGIAVAVNNAVIPKAEWNSKLLQENDKITIIRATQGG